MLPLKEYTDLPQDAIETIAMVKLGLVDLTQSAFLLPDEVSGGMRKRAAIARAMALDPSILFLDEPSAGLDPVVSSALDELILRLRDALDMTIVVVTHELESAFRIADRITVLDKGEILTIGSVEEVRASGNKRIQDLLNRNFEEEILNPDEYLARLTGEPEGTLSYI